MVLARARYRCPVCVVVYAPDPDVAAWAGTPIELGLGGSVFVPQVLGPSAVPWVRTEQEARQGPYRAVLSALSHGSAAGGVGRLNSSGS